MRTSTKCILILGFSILAGCASTPAKRIETKKELFASYPAEIQMQIQAGNVQPGFTEDQVFLAKGEPEEKYQATRRINNEAHSVMVWRYRDRTKISALDAGPGADLSGGYGYPTHGSIPRMSRPYNGANEYLLIEFEHGKVLRVNSPES